MLPSGPFAAAGVGDAAEDVGRGAAADRGGEDQLRHRQEAHVADEGFRRVPADDRALDEVVGGAERVGEAALDPVDDRLLGLLAVEVVVAEGVGALAGAGAFAGLADAGVGEGFFAVEGVLALLEVQGDAALAAAGAAGDVGAELVREVDFDAADGVDQVFEAGEVDDRDVVDLDIEELFDRLDLQGGAAEGEGGVDFGRFVAGDLGVAVARDREFAEGAAAGPDQHQRVGAELAFFAAVVRGVAVGLLFEALLRRGRPRFLGVRRAGVGAEDEDRLGARQQQRVAVQGFLRFAGELERLQLGRDREGQEAEQDPSQSGDPDPFENSLEPRLAAPADGDPRAARDPCQAASQAALRALAGR